jgi:hypothetical protein
MPTSNGATYVSDQPETSYYNVAGRRSGTAPQQDLLRPATTYLTDDAQPSPYRPARARRERGLPGWTAVAVLVVIAGAFGLIDSINGSAVRGLFNWGLVLASLVAIVLVRRSQMFPVVIAPPLVYFAASAGLLYFRSGGLHDRGKLLDAATNWIVYGFPAIAGATAVVLVIAGLRLITRR